MGQDTALSEEPRNRQSSGQLHDPVAVNEEIKNQLNFGAQR
jgi:hypothetical protein